jgi:hypothetical protein
MPRRIAFYGLMLGIICLTNLAIAFATVATQELRLSDYGSLVPIYNYELSALGNRALFPICIDAPSGTSTQGLFNFMRKAGLEVSPTFLCEPATGPGGQLHAKDYPHGLRIFVDNFQRDSSGLVSMHVVTDDLTVRPGEHLASTLRRGTYRLKQTEAGEWQITGYTREYDSTDEKRRD